MELSLKRPLVFFDLETTGTNVASDRIVEIALVKVMPDGTLHTRPEKLGKEHRFLVNPEMPIPVESSMIHGVYDEDVKDAPTFKDIAAKLFKFLHDCDLGGFNSNRFDIPLIAEEFLRAGVDFSIEGRNLIDAQVIFHLMEQRTLSAGYKFYCGKSLDGAHEALPDTMATFEIFKEQIARYEGMSAIDIRTKKDIAISNDMEQIHAFCTRNRHADLMGRLVYNDNDEAVFNFGKYRGKSVKEVLSKDVGYYGWMMQGDFPNYTKKVLKQIKESL
jgi:DNA polymerase-3 subunit epsilon